MTRRHGRFRPGIIPAYAGSTVLECLTHLIERDHPRLRGEHTVCLSFDQRLTGSSPPTRGALTVARDLRGYLRIIPAYAGSTPSLTSG